MAEVKTLSKTLANASQIALYFEKLGYEFMEIGMNYVRMERDNETLEIEVVADNSIIAKIYVNWDHIATLILKNLDDITKIKKALTR